MSVWRVHYCHFFGTISGLAVRAFKGLVPEICNRECAGIGGAKKLARARVIGRNSIMVLIFCSRV